MASIQPDRWRNGSRYNLVLRSPFNIPLGLILGRFLPRTRFAWFFLYLGGVELVLLSLQYGLRWSGSGFIHAAAALHRWTGYLGLVLAVLLAFLFLRWFRGYVLWRLRNRLMITYLFIGGVPVVLVAAMALISGYFLLGQFATFLTVSEVQTQLQRLEAANSATARRIVRRASLPGEAILPGDAVFPGRTVMTCQASTCPKWLKDGFNSVVLERGQVFLRAAHTTESGGQPVTVISSIPLDRTFLAWIAGDLGALTLDRPATVILSAGAIPAPRAPWDREIGYSALPAATDWETGKTVEIWIVGVTRISVLYSRLSASSGTSADRVILALSTLAAIFAGIVAIALFIGVRLTRTITRSVANLYRATRHVNQGDFSHRIEVKERDQLATLQGAFNSMTESLEKLIAEQKENERLQSELAIAQEVQAQLFPSAASSTPTLELYGVCRPARIVSGDYYDFLLHGAEQVGVAVGDISGKGISAALLMATIHSAVRAYEQEQLTAVISRRFPARDARSGLAALALPGEPPRSPAQVLRLLNRQIYKTTALEKYATLFLGFYDGQGRQMTYSNAGHLPPLILGQDGSVRRLTEGGTVVGLFESSEYDEATVDLGPGDIFVAFSDGLTEPENEFGEFGESRLIEALIAYRDLPLERIAENMIAALQDWIGAVEQPDDITLVLARPRG